MDVAYAITPFLAWLAAGTLKFIINSCRARRLAFGQIGYGGLPSNHSAIVSSTAALIAFREGMSHPAFGAAVTIAFVVIMDANGLRRQVGKHATVINRLAGSDKDTEPLRERMGHGKVEIGAGVLMGMAVAWLAH
ncbi:divergent PAP2 family protein [Methylococcus capsulatus]|jgi:acid phosphatase family membrane protein YuiD|uniref:divergent PAP2 family protein n=1 Tax=Methylococcus capsulatus TaxID=414 RepID=UPI001C52D7CF|nr:divergent PAP2 family protein [Methylococcus capsulatus]QXP89639.1 divergent PAP2 family protein [Methylococcus capsulatus]